MYIRFLVPIKQLAAAAVNTAVCQLLSKISIDCIGLL